jgi:hypothetical protein
MRAQRLVLWGAGVIATGLVALLLAFLVRRADDAYAGERSGQTAVALALEEMAAGRTISRLVIRCDGPRRPDALLAGWSTPEAGSGIWSQGQTAVVRLPALSARGPMEVAIDVAPFVRPGRPFQRVTIRAGGTQLGSWRLAAPALLQVRIPPQARAPGDDVELAFDLPDADAPARLDPASPDKRQIALKLVRITASDPI